MRDTLNRVYTCVLAPGRILAFVNQHIALLSLLAARALFSLASLPPSPSPTSTFSYTTTPPPLPPLTLSILRAVTDPKFAIRGEAGHRFVLVPFVRYWWWYRGKMTGFHRGVHRGRQSCFGIKRFS